MEARTLPRGSDLAPRWALDPAVVYLNHGSFGACPRSVLEAQRAYRDRMEAEAVRFFVRDAEGLLDESRAALAPLVGCAAPDLVFVPNATTGVATVLANLEEQGVLGPGDEILITAHEYPACRNGVRRTARRTGATIVEAPIPFPISGPEAAIDAVLSRATARTRLALLSHVTSPSGLVLPVERLVPALEARGIRCIVDGAHGVGFHALALDRLGASYYTSNCHKWLCAPKGSAFLHIRPDRQKEGDGFRPLVLSNRAETPGDETRGGRKHLLTEFDYLGTDDLTAYMAIKDAIRDVASMVPGGWPEVHRRNRDLLLRARTVLLRALGTEAPAPESMLGCLATLLLPDADPERRARLAARPTRYHDALWDALVERHGIQVPIWSVPGCPRRTLRLSAQLYNSIEQYEYLAAALRDELAREAGL